VQQVEEGALEAFMKLVLKLNEKLFRPLFLQLIDWAQLQQELSSLDPTKLKSTLFRDICPVPNPSSPTFSRPRRFGAPQRRG